jgi:hypothetical protein
LSLNHKQKKLLTNVVTVVAFTTAMVVGFANIKNIINRSEATRAMGILGKEILQYRQSYGSLPSEVYVKQYEEAIGAVRLPGLQYRAQWIEYGSDPNKTILAYSENKYRGFVKGGYLVLWLNGKVKWISKNEFEKILVTQQQQQELQWLKEHLQKNKNNLLQ